MIKILNFLLQAIPKKKGRLVGLGRRSKSVPPASEPPPVDPMLMDQLRDKDERIALLESKMAAQEAANEAARRQNERMMELLKKNFQNENFE